MVSVARLMMVWASVRGVKVCKVWRVWLFLRRLGGVWRSVKCGKCGECARVWFRRDECGSGVKVCRVWKCGECRTVRMKQSSVVSVGEVQNMQSVKVSVGVKCGKQEY